MKILNYKKLMDLNPTPYNSIFNQLGQKVCFYEHPIHGEDHTVIGVFPKQKVAFDTDHFDTEDFGPKSDYNPILCDGKVICYFEL